jgi:hypothetical protein
VLLILHRLLLPLLLHLLLLPLLLLRLRLRRRLLLQWLLRCYSHTRERQGLCCLVWLRYWLWLSCWLWLHC